MHVQLSNASRFTRCRRWAAALAVIGTAALPAGISIPDASATEVPQHYLALGDSLAAGYQRLPNGGEELGHGYAQDLAQVLSRRAHAAGRRFDFIDFGCPGETTGSMIHGGCIFPHSDQSSQLARAVEFLVTHHDEPVLVTLDIGANDVGRCVQGHFDGPCVLDRLSTLRANLDEILGTLRAAAGPRTRIVGMNLYDPVLAHWAKGNADGRIQATVSVAIAQAINSLISQANARYGAATADVAGAFATGVFGLSQATSGTPMPLNVARILAWTNMSFGDIHANDTGYRVIADTFLRLL